MEHEDFQFSGLAVGRPGDAIRLRHYDLVRPGDERKGKACERDSAK
jgi:hypothetical protein